MIGKSFDLLYAIPTRSQPSGDLASESESSFVSSISRFECLLGSRRRLKRPPLHEAVIFALGVKGRVYFKEGLSLSSLSEKRSSQWVDEVRKERRKEGREKQVLQGDISPSTPW